MKLMYIPIFSEIGNAALSLLLILDSFIYKLIASSYRIFMALSGARLLSSEAFSMIANKLYIIIGVVMLFVLSYAIIKAIIDPDQMTKGELGGPKLLKGILIAVIGLGITPVVFNMLYQAQGLILEHNVLGKVFLRSDSNALNVGTVTIEGENGETLYYDAGTLVPDDVINISGGSITATYIWQAFFYPSSGVMEDADEIKSAAEDYFNDNLAWGALCGVAAGVATAGALSSWSGIGLIIAVGVSALAVGSGCYSVAEGGDDVIASALGEDISLTEAYVYSADNGDFGIYTNFLDHVSGDENKIEYVFLISTIVGAVVLYAFVSFSIDMGVRCAKLAYYQIIAPIPLILQILPSFKDSFNKYIKSVISTFLEVFIRISVVYIVVYIICHITDLFSSDNVWNGLSFLEFQFARALLIVGLVI
ncbi:MAG: hypothetical protein IJ475_00425, partial [Bacilli bacterium]|nr:hypothetical protein [Bacilli bacterium]